MDDGVPEQVLDTSTGVTRPMYQTTGETMALSGSTPNLNQIDAGKLEESTRAPTEAEEISGRTNSLRADLGGSDQEIRELIERMKVPASDPCRADRGLMYEAIAQAMLALRHVEDARMRLGKVLQFAVQRGVPYGGMVEAPPEFGREQVWEIVREISDRLDHGQGFPMEIKTPAGRAMTVHVVVSGASIGVQILDGTIDGRRVEIEWGHGNVKVELR